jgi:hypothetical protein
VKTSFADLLIKMVLKCLPQTGTDIHFDGPGPHCELAHFKNPSGKISLVLVQPTGNCLVDVIYHLISEDETQAEFHLSLTIVGWDNRWDFRCVIKDELVKSANPTALTLRKRELAEAVRLKLADLGTTTAEIDARLQAMEYSPDLTDLRWYLRHIFGLGLVQFVSADHLGRTVPEIHGSIYGSDMVLRVSDSLSDAMKSFLLRELTRKTLGK